MVEYRRISDSLQKIYGDSGAQAALEKLQPVIEKFSAARRRKKAGEWQGCFSEKDEVLITYGDSLKTEGEAPLESLNRFATEHLQKLFSAIHILPFFPFSSDDGFSVIDFLEVNQELGNWQDIEKLGERFELMFDLVLNHISARSGWVGNYLAGKPEFAGLAIEVDPATDLSQVTRPRALPLLTEFRKESGESVHLWTTFSADQVDINYASPDILARMVEVLLFYVGKGAKIIRLDAIAYLWKEIGTNCVHLPQAHEMVRLFRAVLDQAAPEVIIITETNVPHEENVSYFGDGRNEAQMVYNFTLPPLLLYTFINEDASLLTDWADKYLKLESPDTTFFNFTASHDGIGVRPLEGILAQAEIEKLAELARANGGDVSYKRNPDGSESPYELNITYIDAMKPQNSPAYDSLHARRFIASQTIKHVLPGVPAVYIHSLLGSANWTEGVKLTGRARTINREKLNLDNVTAELRNPRSFRAQVFNSYSRLISIRREQKALHPNAGLRVLRSALPHVFAIAREGFGQSLFSLTNVSSRSTEVSLEALGIPRGLEDILAGQRIDEHSLVLEPYRTAWLS